MARPNSSRGEERERQPQAERRRSTHGQDERPVAASPRPHHLKQESEISSMSSSRQGTLKEESSDESTIISSQTSTLTRNMGPESMLAQAVEGFQVEEDESESKRTTGSPYPQIQEEQSRRERENRSR